MNRLSAGGCKEFKFENLVFKLKFFNVAIYTAFWKDFAFQKVLSSSGRQSSHAYS